MGIPYDYNPIGKTNGGGEVPIPTDYIVYAPCSGYALSAETGQEFSMYEVYDDEYSFNTFKGIPCFQTWQRQPSFLRVEEPSINQGTDKPRAYSFWFTCKNWSPNNMRGVALGDWADHKEMCSPNNPNEVNEIQAGGYGQDFGTGFYMEKNTWYHLVQQSDGNGNLELYVNGNLVYSTSGVYFDIDIDKFTIGANNSESYYDCYHYGNLAGVRLYNRMLTQDEITALANEYVPKYDAIFADQSIMFSNEEGAATKGLLFDNRGYDYQFSIISGTLPNNVTFNPSGSFSYNSATISQNEVYSLGVQIEGRNINPTSAVVEISMFDEIPTDSNDYLCFTSKQNGATVKMSFNDGGGGDKIVLKDAVVEYSLDKKTWNTYFWDTDITLDNDEMVYFRGNNKKFYAYDYDSYFQTCYHFVINNGRIDASGNVMSLLDKTCQQTAMTGDNYDAFNSLFDGCSDLYTAPYLPVTTLVNGCYANMFNGCSNLTTAPELPAEYLSPHCYESMFLGCGLTTPPILSSTHLAEYCYCSMFDQCYALTGAPELPASTMEQCCYYNMFNYCGSITTPPVLSSTSLAYGCYRGMFQNCSNLSSTPELPASDIPGEAYNNMFSYCGNLKDAPILSATSLGWASYGAMFQGCTALTGVPELPATNVPDEAYGYMFKSCYALSAIPVIHAETIGSFGCNEMFAETAISEATLPSATWLGDYACNRMFIDCPNVKTLTNDIISASYIGSWAYGYALYNTPVENVPRKIYVDPDGGENQYAGLFAGCKQLKESPVLVSKNLKPYCYANLFDGASSLSSINVKFTQWYNPEEDWYDYTYDWVLGVADNGIFYCPSGLPDERGQSRIPENWTIDTDDPLTFKAESANSAIRLKSVGTPDPIDLEYSTDGSTWSAYTVGDVIDLTNVDDTVYFRGDNATFSKDTSNRYQFEMSGTIAADGNIMSLLDKDNAKSKLNAGYEFLFLFSGCSGLTEPPRLPATEVSEWSYYGMFYQCTSLTKVPELPATKLGERCYNAMFYGCTSLSGVPKVLPATELPNNCYDSMFRGCTALTDAPILIADASETNAYSGMFNRCSSLSSVNVNFKEWPITTNWLYNVAQTGVFTCPQELSAIYDASNIPVGWTVEYNDYFCLEALEDNSTVKLRKIGNPNPINLSASYDKVNWEVYEPDTTLTLKKAGDKVYLRGDNDYGTSTQNSVFYKAQGDQHSFYMEGKLKASGNIMSLIDSTCKSTTLPKSHQFTSLFYSNVSNIALEDVSELRLPATTLTNDCYEMMFYYCTALKNTPELPATTMAVNCYYDMFYHCESLESAAPISATTLTTQCFSEMFAYCSKLKHIEVAFDNWNDGYSTRNWVYGVYEGVDAEFICPSALTLEYGYNRIPYHWATPTTDYFRLTIDDPDGLNNAYISLQAEGDPTVTPNNLEYSLDRENWNDYTPGDYVELHDYITQKTVLFRSKGANSYFTDNNNFWKFYVETRKVKAGGNIMSLVGTDLTETTLSTSLNRLFYQCEYLVDASELKMPATTLAVDSCYSNMFAGCTSLTKAPKLPATTLRYNCYGGMFNGCTSLTDMPELPAIDLATYCYNWMFNGCTALTGTTDLPATSGTNYCYQRMFYGCTSLVEPPTMHLSSAAPYSCEQMFRNCSSLESATVLSASTLDTQCYANMFRNCQSLKNVPDITAPTLANQCCLNMFTDCTGLEVAPNIEASAIGSQSCQQMFQGCTSLTTPPTLSATSLGGRAYYQMFKNCTSLETAPELPATSIVDRCYYEMFSGCSKLSSITVGFSSWGTANQTYNWVNGVSASGTFHCPSGLSEEYGVNRIPSNWTVAAS